MQCMVVQLITKSIQDRIIWSVIKYHKDSAMGQESTTTELEAVNDLESIQESENKTESEQESDESQESKSVKEDDYWQASERSGWHS